MLYIIGSDDAGEEVPEEDKYKYVDDLATLDAVDTRDKLTEYDYWQHVPSDIASGERYLAAELFKSQIINDQLAFWTVENKMKLNVIKSKYMIFSRSKENFSTRLTIDNQTLERAQVLVHLGRAAERWERWERVPSQFEILAAILADDLRTFVAK